MVNRPAGGARSKKWDRAPYDWYCESPRVVEQLMHGVDFGDDLIWDPCCGRGNILDVAKRYGHPTIGSDVIDRKPRHRFMRGNILTQITRMPVYSGRETSVICNPPYSYEPDIAELIIATILERFNVRRAAFIVPIAFLASQDRWTNNKFAGRWKPSHTAIYRERHTMPPGHLIETMASPFEGGMADYCAVVFTRPHRWRSETIWLSPGHFPDPPRVKPQKENTDGR
ncbi:methyltransferase [Erythrobacter phage vB_EliS_R6L]|nr:methyltransferase [Erythrobacter phage vB_EliS_R6L]